MFWSSIESWAFLGVVVALAIEFAAWKFGAPYKEKLEKAKDLKIAELNNDTTRLRDTLRDSVLANRAVMTTSEVMALAQGLVTSETIGATGRPFLIIAKIAPFAGKQFDAIVTSSDIEQEALLLSLRHALKAAGWIEVSAREQSGATHTPVRGVRIGVDRSNDSTLLDAAKTLASALSAEGMRPQ